MTHSGKLFLLPNLLCMEGDAQSVLPVSVAEAVLHLDGLIAESDRGGRRFLSRFETKRPAREIPIAVMDAKTVSKDPRFFLEPVVAGENWGLVSDAGLPCVADPGAKIVAQAHRLNLNVEAFVGPSSILMALMLSGMSGQRFQFHGYIAKEPLQRKKELQQMERVSRNDRATQIFIEAPYRNEKTLEALLEVLDPKTQLCVAWNLTSSNQGIISRRVEHWPRRDLPEIHKVPAIFLISS